MHIRWGEGTQRTVDVLGRSLYMPRFKQNSFLPISLSLQDGRFVEIDSVVMRLGMFGEGTSLFIQLPDIVYMLSKPFREVF